MGFRVWGSGLAGLGLGVQAFGFRFGIQVLGFSVWGGLRVVRFPSVYLSGFLDKAEPAETTSAEEAGFRITNGWLSKLGSLFGYHK